jgi:WD40 repeat protein
VTEPPRSPFIGLRPFDDSEMDALLFFGRSRDCEVIAANLLAARLTVLYGPSGVGKSSVLLACVTRRLRSLPERPLVVVFSSWANAPETALAAAVAGAAGVEAQGSLAETLHEAVRARGEAYLILDQAEELFLYHGEALVEQLPMLVNSEDLHAHVLLSIREDALARLDVFKRRLPDVLGNYLRLDRLDRAAARSAITGPIGRFNELVPGTGASIEPALVEAVLDEVAEGRIDHDGGAAATAGAGVDQRRVETPYLQLVLERLWHVEQGCGSSRLRRETLDQLGGAQRIVAEHLEDALAGLRPEQRDVASSVFKQLVTPSGSKIAHRLDDLEGYTGTKSDTLASILDRLAERRVVRAITESNGDRRYEIFHDVLGAAVLAWRSRHETERRIEQEGAAAARRQRRLAMLAASALIALAVVAAIAVYALAQRSEAREQSRAATARELTSVALLELGLNPELSVLLAREAVLRDPTLSGEDALRRALIAFRARGITELGASPVAVATAHGELFAVDASGVLHTPDRSVRLADRARAAAFDPNGRLVAVADGDRVLVHEIASGRTLVEVGHAPTQPRLALDGDLLVIAAGDGRVRAVAVASDAVVARFKVPRGPSSVTVAAGRIAVTTGKVARIFDVSRSRLRATIVDRATLRGSALSPDGSLLVTGAADSAVRVWELPSGRLVNVMLGHRNHVTDVVFMRDGLRVVTASVDGTARVWEVDTARSLGVLSGHTGTVTAVAASPDGRLAVTGSKDGTARTWDALGDPHVPVLARLQPPVDDLEVERGRIVARSGPRARSIDLDSGQVDRLDAPPPRRSRFRLDGSEVRYRGRDGSEVVLRGHEDTVSSARYSRDGARVVTASRDADARIWNASDGALIHVLTGHFAAVDDAAFSPDGRWVVTAGPITAGLFDAQAGELLLYLRGHKGRLTAAAFDPTGRWIVTAEVDGTVRTYRCELCGRAAQLLALADRRLETIGRSLTSAERKRYIGG